MTRNSNFVVGYKNKSLNYYSFYFKLRLEETPKDQLQIEPDEHLMPVAHFDKEPGRTFGIPFFIKITNGEKVSNIRERIRQLLDVPEKEFEKVSEKGGKIKLKFPQLFSTNSRLSSRVALFGSSTAKTTMQR